MSDDLLEDLLNSVSDNEDENFFEEENKRIAPLLPEIDLIVDQKIRSFVRSMLYHVDVFWDVPSSLNGTSPPDEQVAGGNILHTKRVVRTAALLCRSQGRPQDEVDLVIAAAILHDLTKVVILGDQGLTVDIMHPYTVDLFASLIFSMDEQVTSSSNRSSVLYLDEVTLSHILRLIRCHMGPWSPIPETFPQTSLEWIMHYADMVATHLHNIIDGDDVKAWRWNEPTTRRRRPKTPEETKAD